MNRIQVKGNRFVDQSGCEILLHGINLVCKDRSKGYIGSWDQEAFKKLKQWGFNVVRLGVIWDGLEPLPGTFDFAYIERLRTVIHLAHQADIYVFLDMHQDLFSVQFGDGAPAWATITDGFTYEPYPLWSDAYLHNEAVQRAFDHFWNNDMAPDGVGIQEHYALAWRKLAEELGREANVIGYDLMNEPFMGTSVQQMLAPLMEQLAADSLKHGSVQLDSSDANESKAALSASLLDPEHKLDLLQWLEHPDRFQSFLHALAPTQQAFERGPLMSMYNRVGQAIREVDQTGILFIETHLFSNLGVPSGIEPITNEQGSRDPQQAYAPHGYDLVTDTTYMNASSNTRVSILFDQHEQTRKRLQMPMLIGEWGAYYGSQEAEASALHVKGTLEKLLCGDTYWSYDDAAVDEYSSFNGIQRGIPHAVAGTLLAYGYDPHRRDYVMKWEEEGVESSTIVYLPYGALLSKEQVSLSPNGSGFMIDRIPDCEAGYLVIPSYGKGERELVIRDLAT